MPEQERVFSTELAQKAIDLADDTRGLVILTINGVRVNVYPGELIDAVEADWRGINEHMLRQERDIEERRQRREQRIIELKKNPRFALASREKWEQWIDSTAQMSIGLTLIEQTERWAAILEQAPEGADANALGLFVGLDSGAYDAAARILRDVWERGPEFYRGLVARKLIINR